MKATLVLHGALVVLLTNGPLCAAEGHLGNSSQSADGLSYDGRPLSVWADRVLALNKLARVVNTNNTAVQAIRAIGTNAIPWLLAEMAYRAPHRHYTRSPDWAGIISHNEGQDHHQLRARACFWALGELAKPAIPGLVSLLKRQPDLASSALVGIGAPALPTLEGWLTNAPPQSMSVGPREQSVASAFGGLYVAIDVGRISKSEARPLLSAARVWAQSRHPLASFWADAVLQEFAGGH